ncbi:hypothetical protein CHH92_18180 [Bacillus sonorensis]|uniref:Uncharacterized protein n=1 Tax=Bacillus sonorensis L12 TaxID=1274524 RepID=M5P6R4_9BACI|nr:hypothetical protein BSONL12_05333 [Bacillus sonorensis L12]MBG9915027.1 hypothetical protein [Bacillus sonorensis]PAD58774.1 hypothetical protein CHH92_18180 [Bacillus sonorensis]RHJ06612.1 hypothetical protein DW143_19725 [Bacillus sonorensis]
MHRQYWHRAHGKIKNMILTTIERTLLQPLAALKEEEMKRLKALLILSNMLIITVACDLLPAGRILKKRISIKR